MAAGTAARFISMARAPDEAAATRKAPVRTVMMYVRGRKAILGDKSVPSRPGRRTRKIT